jgi:nickel-type superoxide dismutase maturation protease
VIQKLQLFLATISPLIRCQISGNSMKPTFTSGETVLVNKLAFLIVEPKQGDIIVIKRDKLLVKRVEKKKENSFFVVGDNKKESTDSRHFGWVDKKDIVGKVIYKI